MKVLLIDVNCKYSSTGKIVYDLYTNLNMAGHTAGICYGRGLIVNEPNISRISSKLEVYIHAFLTRITGFTGCFSPFATRKLLNIMKRFKPDVVHIHELHGYYVNIAPVMKFLKKHNIKTVWTFHCEFMYTGKCGHAYECENWKSICGKCPYLHDYPASLYFDRTRYMFKQKKIFFQNMNNLKIVTPSKWLADRVWQSFLSKHDISVIHNGIDTNVFYPRNTQELKKGLNADDKKVILAVAPGLMSDQKGGNHILNLAKKMDSSKYKFILVGVDESEVSHDENVIKISRTSNQNELAEYYSMADAFVICSSRENFPTTCLEAQCCGAPVCGFDTGGTRETSLNQNQGFVKYADIAGLKQEIINTLSYENLETRSKRAENAKNAFSKEKMFQEYLKLYK